MIAFSDELQKISSLGSIAQAARGLLPGRHVLTSAAKLLPGHLGQVGMGAAVGGLAGGALDKDNRARGALLGAGAGAGLAGTRILASPVEREKLVGGLKRFGARQKYYLTGRGVKDTAKAEEIGLLKAPDVAKHEAEKATLSPRGAEKAQKNFDREQAEHTRERTAFEAGDYNVPGVFRSMVTQPQEFFKRQWHRQGDFMGIPHAGKAFAGLSAYQTGKELSRKGEPGEEGRFTRAGRALGSGAGWFASPRGFMPGLVVAPVLSRVGGLAGKGLDTVLKTKPPAAQAGELAPPPSPEGGV